MRSSTLASVTSHIVDCEHKTAPVDANGEFFAVGTPAMRGNRIDYGQARRISKSTYDEWTKRLTPEDGDILFAREAPVGPLVLVPAAGNVAPGQRTVLIRADPSRADSTYLYYYLSAEAQQRRIQQKASGSTVPHLNVADIRSFQVDLPSLPEQRTISEVLGALDGKVEANIEIALASRRLADAVYDQAVVGRELVRLSDVVVPVLGATPSRRRVDYWGGSNAWVSARDVTAAPSGVVLSTLETISDNAASETRAKPLRAGSVILTARGTVGAVARLGIASSFNQSCYGFESGALPPGVLYYTVLRASKQLRSMAHGSVFDTITMSTFEHLGTPKLNALEIARLEEMLGPLLDAITSAMKENTKLRALRDTLLPQLMSGKLRIHDAETTLEEVL